jgi:diguanylate cyclase (GGDEF)-like protein
MKVILAIYPADTSSLNGHAMDERRQESRRRTLKAGKIVFNNKRSVFDCLVRNLSENGACLQIDSSIDLPTEFDLYIRGEPGKRSCHLVWLSDTRAGIDFKAPARETSIQVATEAGFGNGEIGSNESITLCAALDHLPIGILLLDADTRARFINRAYRRMWRLPDEKADSRPPFIALLYHGRDTRAYAIPSGDLDRYVAERVEHVKTGDPRPLDLRLSSGQVVRMHCTALPAGGRMLSYTYVTDLAKDSDELMLLRSSLDQLQQGIILLDKFSNAQLMNRAVRKLWGVSDEQADRKSSYVELVNETRKTGVYGVPADQLDKYIEDRIAVIRAGDDSPIDIRHGDGRIIRSQCTALPGGGRMLTYTDVTDLVSRAKQFEHLATVDALTGLYNRRHFCLLAEAEWDRFQRYHRPLSLLMIDIDRFREINDRYGHETGDDALKELARVCMEEKRTPDIVARLGGDEFLLLLPETKLQHARVLAERIQKVAATKLDGATFSVGIAEASLSMSDFEALLRRADRALYQAKSAGKNCIRSSLTSALPMDRRVAGKQN